VEQTLSEVRTARKRNEWLPNRMFDPTTNPFAVQNLLDRTAPPFVEQREELPEAMFGVDPLTGGYVAAGFQRDSSLDLPDEDFAIDEVIADPFVAEDSSPAPGFAPEAASETGAEFNPELDENLNAVAKGFEADADSQTLASDEAIAKPAPTSEVEAFAAATDAIVAEISSTDPASQLATEGLAAPSDEADRVAATDAEASTQIASEDGTVKHQEAASTIATEPHLLSETLSAQAAELLEDALLDNEAVAQKIEAARAEAYAQGLEAGRNEGRESERPIAHQQGYDEGLVAGLEQGRAETQTD
jgi:hypothetical protein